MDEAVFAPWDYPLFAALSALNLVSIGFVAWYWVVKGGAVPRPLLFVLIAAPFALGLLIYECRWFAMPFMHRPGAMNPAAGWSVGVAPTFVPGAEPIEMLAETLRALVAMDYPHDTWVLDEGNDDRVKALCRSLGAQHFSRKDAIVCEPSRTHTSELWSRPDRGCGLINLARTVARVAVHSIHASGTSAVEHDVATRSPVAHVDGGRDARSPLGGSR